MSMVPCDVYWQRVQQLDNTVCSVQSAWAGALVRIRVQVLAAAAVGLA